MFIGHYGVSLAAKRQAPDLSLGWLFLAVQGLDVLFGIFVLSGVEHLRIVPGFTRYNPYDLYDMPWSHSLLSSVGWSIAITIAVRAMGRSWPVASALGGAVFSHFVLDLPMHTPDMPLWSNDSVKLGLGLWNHVPLSLVLELLCFALGALSYARTCAALGPRFWCFVAAMVGLTLATPFLPPPGGPREFAVQALFAYVALAFWAAWLDRSLRARSPMAPTPA
jgi:hypothetical protein